VIGQKVLPGYVQSRTISLPHDHLRLFSFIPATLNCWSVPCHSDPSFHTNRFQIYIYIAYPSTPSSCRAMDATPLSEHPHPHTTSDPQSSPPDQTSSASKTAIDDPTQSNPTPILDSTTVLAPDGTSKPTSAGDNIEASPITPTTSTQSVVRISLLLTTGSRHPMTVTRNYLKKRNMVPEDGDPYNITVYQLKQLIWNDWRSGAYNPIICDSEIFISA